MPYKSISQERLRKRQLRKRRTEARSRKKSSSSSRELPHSKRKPGVVCDGCSYKCTLSIMVDIKKKENREYVVKPVVYAGGVRAYNASEVIMTASSARDCEIDFLQNNSRALYRRALLWCKDTCKKRQR